MEISDVTAIPLSDPVPEEKRHRTDLGTKVKTDAALVFVETADGARGVGAALGSPPVVETVVESDLAPALAGEDPMDTERCWETLYAGSRAEPSLDAGYSQPRGDRRGVTMAAISGVDIALWDLKATALDLPLYKLLGASRDSIPAYASGGWAAGEAVGDQLAEYVDAGFDAVKMRIVGENSFSLDRAEARVAAAREAVGNDIDLMIDAHGSLDASTAVRLAERLEPHDVEWFEEPVSPDDHPGLVEVRHATSVPIAAGEREFTRFAFRDLFDREAVDVIQPDLARVGGITEARRVAAMASARGLHVAPHAWGSGILFAASLHFALATPNCHILEVSQAHMPLLFDLFEEEFDIRSGVVHPPDRPGLGFNLRDDLTEQFGYVEGPQYIY